MPPRRRLGRLPDERRELPEERDADERLDERLRDADPEDRDDERLLCVVLRLDEREVDGRDELREPDDEARERLEPELRVDDRDGSLRRVLDDDPLRRTFELRERRSYRGAERVSRRGSLRRVREGSERRVRAGGAGRVREGSLRRVRAGSELRVREGSLRRVREGSLRDGSARRAGGEVVRRGGVRTGSAERVRGSARRVGSARRAGSARRVVCGVVGVRVGAASLGRRRRGSRAVTSGSASDGASGSTVRVGAERVGERSSTERVGRRVGAEAVEPRSGSRAVDTRTGWPSPIGRRSGTRVATAVRPASGAGLRAGSALDTYPRSPSS